MYILTYLIGSVVTLLCLIFLSTVTKKKLKPNILDTKITQSYINTIYGPFPVMEEHPIVRKTQATEFEKKNSVAVILIDRQAYWIFNNTLFVADEVDGVIDSETTRAVDTMTMDKVQLDKTIFIVEALTEGAENDNWNSGNKSF